MHRRKRGWREGSDVDARGGRDGGGFWAGAGRGGQGRRAGFLGGGGPGGGGGRGGTLISPGYGPIRCGQFGVKNARVVKQSGEK